MANLLKMAEVAAIQTLRERGWSNRRIARELGVNRETVGRYVRALQAAAAGAGAAGQNRPNPPTGSGNAERPNLPAGPSGPPSRCTPWREVILAGLERGLSAQRIWQDLCGESGFAGSYDSVKRYCRRLARACGGPLPYRRMECAPGAEAQVDFGKGAPVVSAQRRRRTHVLRLVLSYSRKGYSEAVFRQTTDDFLRCLENAFWAWGGVPATLVLDNLRAAVSRADWFDPELNPKVQSFCAHYGIVALPTKPRTPRHKGKVERGVGYVQDNALKGRQFTSMEGQNAHLRQWEATVADTRIHGTTKRQVQQVFEQIERPALRPLPASRFPYFQEGQRVVNRDGHVEVAKAYYSAPPEYLGRRLWVRWDAHLVRLFDGRMRPIAIHPRKEEGRFSTQSQHIVAEKINGVERGATYLLRKAEGIGTPAGRWARAMLEARGIEGVRVLQGLLALAGKYPGERIDRACEIALTHEAFRLRTLRTLLRRAPGGAASGGGQQQTLPGFLDEHPIIRPLADYGQIVHEAFVHPQPPRKGASS